MQRPLLLRTFRSTRTYFFAWYYFSWHRRGHIYVPCSLDKTLLFRTAGVKRHFMSFPVFGNVKPWNTYLNLQYTTLYTVRHLSQLRLWCSFFCISVFGFCLIPQHLKSHKRCMCMHWDLKHWFCISCYTENSEQRGFWDRSVRKEIHNVFIIWEAFTKACFGLFVPQTHFSNLFPPFLLCLTLGECLWCCLAVISFLLWINVLLHLCSSI